MPVEKLALAEPNQSRNGSDAASDENLMLRYQIANDEAAATELIERYSLPLKCYLRRLVSDSVAEDLVQATFLRVHEHRDTYQQGHPVHAWIYSIATHVAIDWMRHASRAKAISLEGSGRGGDADDSRGVIDFVKGHLLTSLDEAEADESRGDVRRAIDRLPPHLRSACMLIDMRELSYADASRILHVPVGTVKSRVYHARQQLRRDLEPDRPEE
ncbi:MAG TPA: RNA polymerase sigma factor [Caulifigura sp.]|nr:RNA polymerase sigma factor [Caulifigura sp.]